MKSKVIIGKKYGMLTPLRVVGRDKQGLLLYECLCDCGNIKNIGSRYLTEGKTVSCGCKRARSLRMGNSPTYKSWMSAKQRCYNTNNHNYPNYGGRGIKMCDKWVESFAAFFEDMGERPSLEHTLDRIDVNGDYEPSNCRWATRRTQSNNRRDNIYLDVKGEKLTVSEFSAKYNINRSNVAYELNRGLSATDILEKYNNMESLLCKRSSASIENLKKVRHKKNGFPIAFEEVDELNKTERGMKGYGSSGE